MPQPAVCTVSPELLAVYLTQHWLPQHAGSQLPGSDARIAAPASLASMLSHLSAYLEHVEGRVGPHQLLPHDEQQGNPVPSSAICLAQLRKGYSKEMHSKGVSQGAATPVCFDRVQQLLQAMETVLHDSEPHIAAAVMAAHDGILISTLRPTALRGDNADRLRAKDIVFDDGSSVADFLASGSEIQPGSQLYRWHEDASGGKQWPCARRGIEQPRPALVCAASGGCSSCSWDTPHLPVSSCQGT